MTTKAQDMEIARLHRQIAAVYDGAVTPAQPEAPKPTPAPTVAQGPVGNNGSLWHLTFADEFAGSKLDATKWRPGDIEKADGYMKDFNDTSKAFYLPDNVIFRDGKMILQAIRRATSSVIHTSKKNTFMRTGADAYDMYYSDWLVRNFDYQSGCVSTCPDKYGLVKKDWKPTPATFDFLYGWMEARIKLPKGKGLWPAFWTKRSDAKNAQEIDILEMVDPECRRIALHLHGGAFPGWDRTQVEGLGYDTGIDLSQDFHVFGCNWQKDSIEWFVDGVSVQRFTDKAIIPDGPMYLLLNLAVGGSWPGYPDSKTVFPAEMQIDWVRVWQK